MRNSKKKATKRSRREITYKEKGLFYDNPHKTFVLDAQIMIRKLT